LILTFLWLIVNKFKNDIILYENMDKKRLRKLLQRIKNLPTFAPILLAVGIIFGVLVAAQWHSLPTRVTNPIAPYSSLKETREMLQEEQVTLKEEVKKNQEEISRLQNALKGNPNDEKLLSELEIQKAKAGITKIEGPGVTIILDDSKTGPTTEESIVHASDIRDIINLLWGSGAEAISVNNERIVTTSSIDCIVNTILINDTRIAAPFKIDVIGDQKLILAQIRNKENLGDLYSRHDKNGLVIDIAEVNNLSIEPYSSGFELKIGSSNV